MQIPIQNNNSSNGKKLTAGEEVEFQNYFSADTYLNNSNMQNIKQELQSVPNGIKYGVVGIIILVAIITTFALSGESEAEKAGRIAKLDYLRQEQLKENEAARQAITNCDLAIKQEIGKDNEIVPCTARTLSGSTLVPKASAMESNSGTDTGTTIPVSSGFERTHKDEVIMENICSAAPNSPLCGKWELYARLQDITITRLPEAKYGRMWEILLGIIYAESHIGQNYAKDKVGGTCVGRFNMGGSKYQIFDNNERAHSRQMNGFNYGVEFHSRYEDQYGCNLYPFKSYEEYWESKVNGMRYGWHRCIVGNSTPISCIANGGYLTGNKENWIKNVASFLVTDEMMSAGQP